MELKGWKARVVLAAAIITCLNALLTIPVFIALMLIH